MSNTGTWNGERLDTTVFNETTVEHLHRYAIATDLVENKKVLDIACGEGYGSYLLASSAADVTGIDADLPTIESARRKYKKDHLRFLTGTATALPCKNNEFDIVVSYETLEHLEDHKGMLGEIKRVLTPGGLLILSTPNKEIYSDKKSYSNPFHVKELYEKELVTLLGEHFLNMRLLRQLGTGHSMVVSDEKTEVVSYSGDFIQLSRPVKPPAVYFIALASDTAIPHVHHSVFLSESIFENAIIAREELVRRTITYRLGHLLLWPFKKLVSLLKQ